jgi:hypothetical protein
MSRKMNIESASAAARVEIRRRTRNAFIYHRIYQPFRELNACTPHPLSVKGPSP